MRHEAMRVGALLQYLQRSTTQRLRRGTGPRPGRAAAWNGGHRHIIEANGPVVRREGEREEGFWERVGCKCAPEDGAAPVAVH